MKIIVTPEEYLSIDQADPWKNEYRDGSIVPVQHPNIWHMRIASNTSCILWESKNSAAIDVFTLRMRLWIEAANYYAFPDIVAVDGSAKFADSAKEIMINPNLIAEVYSPETEEFDREGKFAVYQKLPSLRQYLLISQNKPQVELYTLGDNLIWFPQKVVGLDGVIPLQSIGCTLPMSEIYDRVEFKTSEEPTPASS